MQSENTFNDAEILGNMYNVYINALKYYYEELYGCILVEDNKSTLFKKYLEKSKYNNLKYENKMYQDKYKDGDEDVFGKDKDKYMNISIYDALKQFEFNFGNFVVPTEFLEYVKESYNKNEFGKRNIPNDDRRFSAAKRVAEELLDKYSMPYQSVIAIIGALWVECGWEFEKPIINEQEANADKTGLATAFATGAANAGECWFGLTNISQKRKVAKYAEIPKTVCDPDSASYGRPGNRLCDLGWDYQVKILYAYVTKMQPKWGNILADPDGDPGEQIAASFIFKAGFGTAPTLEECIRTANIYMNSHAKVNKITNVVNLFSLQLFMSMKFAIYLDSDAIPNDEDVISTFE